MQLFTIATMSSVPRARALAASIARHQPDWRLEVMLVGRSDAIAALAQAEGSITIGSLAERLQLDVEALLARHDEPDLVALLGPHVLLDHAERNACPALLLPSSAWLLADLAPVERALHERSVLLFPRLTGGLPADGLEPTRTQLERAGRVDDTVMAVDGSEEACEFLRWWAGRLEASLGSIDAMRVGERPEDRPWLARFLELAPARFATGVMADAGCNLSLWNLHEHLLADGGEQDGGVLVDGRDPARLMQLPGFDPDRPHRLAANASRARVSRSPTLRSLCERYARELRDAGWSDADLRHEVGRRLAGGLVYDGAMRELYGRALALGEGVEDLFSDAGTAAFLAWLEGPAPRGAALGINRYVFYRVSRERPDVLRAYPDLDGEDGVGYLEWCWAFGRVELGIPDRFMPPRPASPGSAPAHESSPQPGAREGTPAPPSPPPSGADPAPVAASQPGQRPQAPQPAEPRGEQGEHSDTSSEPDALAVRLTGYLGHALGLGAAARGYVQALGAAGVPVSTVTVPLHHLALPVPLEQDYGRHSFADLVHEGGHGFEIVAVNADELPSFVERLGEEYFEGPRIGIWGWETNSIPQRWQRAFSLVDEIWVYSRFMAENIGAVAPVPVLSLPPPVERPPAPAQPLRLGVPEGFLFLFVFDYLSTLQRKNPVGLVEAFKRAFAPGEGPQLLVKTLNAPLRPLSEEELLWAVDGREDIHVVDRSLSGLELSSLMAACDCYVSLHRAEGFGLTLAEAMAIGKPAIATRYSGNLDFMNDENSYLVDFAIGRVGPDCEIYPPEGEWAEPSIEHAAALMRAVYEDREEAARRGSRAAQDIAATLSPAARGAAMRGRLRELASSTNGRRRGR